MSTRARRSRNFLRNWIQNSLVTETNRLKNKLNNFGNLIGQNSHVPVRSTTSAHFEFVPRKNKPCIWSRSQDMDNYIFHAFRNNFLFLTVIHRLILSTTISLTHTPLFWCFSFSSVYTHTHTHTRKYCYITQQTRILRYVRIKHSHNICISHTHEYLTNNIRTFFLLCIVSA